MARTMSAAPTTPSTGDQPALPTWEQIPTDLAHATGQIKTAIRARIESSGRSVEEVFAALEAAIAERVNEVEASNEAGQTSWTVVDYDDIAGGNVGRDTLEHLRRSGCLVVRNHFAREQALQWDADILNYVEANDFSKAYGGADDGFFGTDKALPEMYPIYWSSAQMEAHQSDRMATVQSFLHRRWNWTSNGSQWFDPDHHAMYPDRIRRRPPGVDSAGLGAHFDTGNLDLWMTSAYQAAFRHIFDGAIESFDPWDAAHRTAGTQYPGTTMCSAFRTFQGWTALSDMANDQGVLWSIPIPEAIAYLLLRPLLCDVADDEMCGVTVNRVFALDERWHSLLLRAKSSIPDVQAGDSVWWHCDLVHGVAGVTDQVGWGNVMYIPAAPWCERNEIYAANLVSAFETGSSPSDFPEEHYERGWSNRFSIDQLNEHGRRGLGLGPARAR